jgi:hypothetical protein
MENERKDKIEYRKEGDYYIPNLIVPKDEYANYINQIARISNSRYSTSHDDYNYISKNFRILF